MADKGVGSWTGLNDDEAQEFHKFYIQGMIMFVVVAIVAHVLVWAWRPWIPAENGYAALEGVKSIAGAVLPFVA